MKKLTTILAALTVLILWSDVADAQINLYKRYKHKKHKNIYLQDDSQSGENAMAVALYGTGLKFMGVAKDVPFMYGATLLGSFHRNEKSYLDLGFIYLLPVSKTYSETQTSTFGTSSITVKTDSKYTYSAMEIPLRAGYDFIGSIYEDFSLGVFIGATYMLLDIKEDFTTTTGSGTPTTHSDSESAQQAFLNFGLASGFKVGPGQIKVDAAFALPANKVNDEDVEVQIGAPYVRFNLGYKIAF